MLFFTGVCDAQHWIFIDLEFYNPFFYYTDKSLVELHMFFFRFDSAVFQGHFLSLLIILDIRTARHGITWSWLTYLPPSLSSHVGSTASHQNINRPKATKKKKQTKKRARVQRKYHSAVARVPRFVSSHFFPSFDPFAAFLSHRVISFSQLQMR